MVRNILHRSKGIVIFFIISKYLISVAWARANPHKVRLLGGMSALSGSYYVYHLEKAPITGKQKILPKY